MLNWDQEQCTKFIEKAKTIADEYKHELDIINLTIRNFPNMATFYIERIKEISMSLQILDDISELVFKKFIDNLN